MNQVELSHIPVLPEETLLMLNLKPGQIVVDGTVGLGGHSKMIAERIGEKGKLFCFDWDQAHLDIAKKNVSCRDNSGAVPTFIRNNYSHIVEELAERGITEVDTIFLDIGICNAHLQNPERGFSFRTPAAPLDMRMDSSAKSTAAEILNKRAEKSLADIFYHYGEIHSSRRLAEAIRKVRRQKPFKVCQDLLDVVQDTFGSQTKVLAQVWQALRIAVNDELQSLQDALPALAQILKPNGKLAVITFHSLEDRIVKNFFRDIEKATHKEWQRCNKKPMTATREELTNNPKSRSAKLRVLIRNVA